MQFLNPLEVSDLIADGRFDRVLSGDDMSQNETIEFFSNLCGVFDSPVIGNVEHQSLIQSILWRACCARWDALAQFNDGTLEDLRRALCGE